METISKCPFCGRSHDIQNTSWGTIYKCEKERCYHLSDDLMLGIDDLTKERYLNAIYNYVEQYPYIQKDGMKCYWKFFYEETDASPVDDVGVNVYHLMKQYPYQLMEKVEKILLNLGNKYPLLSDSFAKINSISHGYRMFYMETNDLEREINAIFSALTYCGYIERLGISQREFYDDYRISFRGWQKISELRKSSEMQKKGFIAMSFDPSVSYIEELFCRAIREVGYQPSVIKNKEHNNYIMPEIFYEIETSKFIVVDITKQNYGAYYEAGYAQALGKEVILCCKKEIFDNPETKPHFDIAQKSMILWENEQDLIDRLKRRIIATVK